LFKEAVMNLRDRYMTGNFLISELVLPYHEGPYSMELICSTVKIYVAIS